MPRPRKKSPAAKTPRQAVLWSLVWKGWGYCNRCNADTKAVLGFAADYCSNACAELDGKSVGSLELPDTVAPADVSERGLVQDANLPDRKRWCNSIRSVQFRTARYSNRRVASCGLAPVRITRWPPRWKLPYQTTTVMELAPTAALLKASKESDGHRKFDEGFAAQLAALDPEQMAGRLIELAGNGRGLVLLCYEDLRVPGNYCHRQQVAAWLAATYGVQVEELPE